MVATAQTHKERWNNLNFYGILPLSDSGSETMQPLGALQRTRSSGSSKSRYRLAMHVTESVQRFWESAMHKAKDVKGVEYDAL
ncbi:hypothetical protein [Sinorhizobium mexicanum]|uniref:Uncharacterized protein n=1 Tax=Sinorhizobium mexicanum TaxID=375549 RepID=A0A859QI10_9HYPH|nr:hypothetical protein [Sinorhizobium mexicanum]MBP1883211.1 hypothetical protein [Sinorhizobium mexicanum]QLL62425.1 hypothetical protein FKV68_13750 [Sinorhizobium mexicanum]